MRRLEIIHLRLGGNAQASLIENIRKSILMRTEKHTVRLYTNASVSTDLSIHIQPKTRSKQKSYSDLGLRLAAALREFGMVKHTVWIENETDMKRLPR